jgi:acetoacetate decarboxylase
MRFRNVEILTGIYRTDPEVARLLVPPPLELAGDLVIVHVYKMNDTDGLGVYNESAVQIPVVYTPTGERGVFSPYLFLDSDGGIAAGRELYGQPKKSGFPSIETRQDLIVGRVERNGIDVVTLTMAYKMRALTRADMGTPMDFVTNFNLKVIPATSGGDAVRELTARELLDLDVHEIWGGPVTVEIRPNAQAPIYRLPVVDMLDGFFWRCDFTLGHGRVLHDYLGAHSHDGGAAR